MIVNVFSLQRLELLILCHSSLVPTVSLSFSNLTFLSKSVSKVQVRLVCSPLFFIIFFPPRNRLTTQTEYATLVWNVTAAFERWALIKIHLCFAFLLQLTPPSLAAFTDTHSWFYCAGFLVFLSLLNHHPQRLLLNKIVGGDGCVKSVFLKYGFMSLSVWVYKWQWE